MSNTINYKNEIQIYQQMKPYFYNSDDIKINDTLINDLITEFELKRKKYIFKIGVDYEPYPSIENERKITRQVINLINTYGHYLAIHTSSNLVLRDLDLIKKINKVSVFINVSLNDNVAKIIEPNSSTINEKIDVIKKIKNNNIPVFVIIKPVFSKINDSLEDLKSILSQLAECNIDGIIKPTFSINIKENEKKYLLEKITKEFPMLKREYSKLLKNNEIISQFQKYLTDYFIKFCNNKNILFNEEDIYKLAYELDEEKSYEQISLF